MAKDGSSNVAMVLMFILILGVGIALFLFYRGGYFGGGEKDVNIKVNAPVSVPSQPSPQ
jgi:hypothetical protein